MYATVTACDSVGESVPWYSLDADIGNISRVRAEIDSSVFP